MSGNVSQMVGLLEMCLTTMDKDISPGTVMHASINAINAVHKVYTGMQVRGELWVCFNWKHRAAVVRPV